MSNYTAEFEPFYTSGWENQPSENTPIMGEALDEYDSTLVKIEEFLSNLDLSGLGSDYALLTEAGYALNLSVDSNYVLTVDLLNKAGTVLSSKNVDLPLESMFINATYANGVITLTLQNGNTLDVDISDIVRGLVPTSRTIAGIDLVDDVTKEELQNALEIYDSTVMGGELKPWLYDTENEVEIGVRNGKPLYRKTFDFSLADFSGASGFTFDAQHDDSYYDEIYIANGSFLSIGSSNEPVKTLPINYYHDNESYVRTNIQYIVDNNWCVWLKITNAAALNNVDTARLHVVLEYTKTTDAEGSGNNLNPYGIYSAKLDEVKADIEELQNAIVTTDSTTLENSHSGRVRFNSIVGGMEQKTTSGKNLLEITNLAPSASRGLSVEHLADGGVRVYGTHDGTGTFIYVLNEALEMKAGSYILSGCPSGGSSTTYSLRPIQTQGNTDIGAGKTSDIGEDTTWQPSIVLASGVYNTKVDLTFYPMIRLATETDATYEPFTNGASPNPDYPQPINGSVIEKVRVQGEQLFDANALELHTNTSLNVSDDGYTITVVGGKGKTYTNSSIELDVNKYIGKTIYISLDSFASSNANSNAIAQIRYVDANGKSTISSINNGTKKASLTVAEDAVSIIIRIYTNITASLETDNTVIVKGFMVSLFEDAEWKPYQSKEIALSQPITLYNDVLRENVERKYKKKVFDGSDDEGWSLYNNNSYQITVDKSIRQYDVKLLCNYAIGATWNNSTDWCFINEYNIFTIGGSNIIALFPTLEDWKAHLAEKPMTVVYELAEPTTEELPTIDRIALNSLPTYDGITYVEFVNVGVQPSVSLDYGTSKVGGMTLEGLLAGINGELQSKENNERISALESAVVNNV